MEKIFSAVEVPRVPPDVNGIQVNFCKNPSCSNYGVPATLDKRTAGGRVSKNSNYTLTGSPQSYPLLVCKSCDEKPPIKSNAAISEELHRLSAYLNSAPDASCPSTFCAHHRLGVKAHPDRYHGFGKTRAGSSRFRCKACQKTFSVGRSTLRQKAPHKNKDIFSLIINKMPFRRILEHAGIGAGTLYGKIDFIHSQCLKFAADRERGLQGMEFDKLSFSTDRQDYMVNWTMRKDKRTVQLTSIGTAENQSGYILGMHLNFDHDLNPEAVEADAFLQGDYDVATPYRQYARLWLKEDYAKSAKKSAAKKAKNKPETLVSEIEELYRNVADRQEVEIADEKDGEIKLPLNGMQTRLDYTAYGHFFLLRKLLPNVGQYCFYMDQDSALRAACLSAFQKEISNHKADAFFVKINKEMQTGDKRASMEKAEKQFKQAMARHPDLTKEQLKLALIKEQFPAMRKIGKWGDRWMLHPLPTMGEPEKAVCCLTDMGAHDEDFMMRLYRDATMNPIDRFFMQVRNRISLLSRPAMSPSSKRIWYGNSAYNPEMVVKLLEIFRVHYNYVLQGKDKKSPAMRLGLAKGTVTIEDIIYF